MFTGADLQLSANHSPERVLSLFTLFLQAGVLTNLLQTMSFSGAPLASWPCGSCTPGEAIYIENNVTAMTLGFLGAVLRPASPVPGPRGRRHMAL